MGLPGTDYVSEAEDAAGKIEHVTVGSNQPFTRQLARAVSRNRYQRAVVLVRLLLSQIPIHTAAGGVENTRGATLAHGLDKVVGEISAFPKINVRFSRGARNVGIGGEVNHHAVAFHSRTEQLHVLYIAAQCRDWRR